MGDVPFKTLNFLRIKIGKISQQNKTLSIKLFNSY